MERLYRWWDYFGRECGPVMAPSACELVDRTKPSVKYDLPVEVQVVSTGEMVRVRAVAYGKSRLMGGE